MEVVIESKNYKLAPHWSKVLGQFHYHLILDKTQKADIKNKDIFRTLKEIQDAELNEELTKLLMYGISDGAKYIKVKILSEGADNGQK